VEDNAVIGLANDHRLPRINGLPVHLVSAREGLLDGRFESMQGDGGEERRNDAAGRRPLLGRSQVHALHHPGLEPCFDGSPEGRGGVELVQQGCVVDAIEAFRAIRVDHVCRFPAHMRENGFDRIVGGPSWSKAVAVWFAACVPFRFEEEFGQGLPRSVK